MISDCFENGLLSNPHPLYQFTFSEAWKRELQALYYCLHGVGECCQGDSLSQVHVYLTIHQTLQLAGTCLALPDDSAPFIQSVLTGVLQTNFDEDLVCAEYFLMHPPSTPSLFTEKDRVRAIQRFCGNAEHEAVLKEFESFLTVPVATCFEEFVLFWNGEGKSVYPNLSKLACAALCDPLNKDMMKTYSNIKTCIHLHVRSRKDGDKENTKSSDEMMISCNRHLVVRWNLDFQ